MAQEIEHTTKAFTALNLDSAVDRSEDKGKSTA
jgi:hypothetical protein